MYVPQQGAFSSCLHIQNMLVLEKWKAKDVQLQFTDLPLRLIQSMEKNMTAIILGSVDSLCCLYAC